MSDASAAARFKSIFLCAVRWFTGQLLCAVRCAPDRHCRLSGAPISRFKKIASSPKPSQRLFCSSLLSVSPCSPAISPLSGDPSHRRLPSGEPSPVLTPSPLRWATLAPSPFSLFSIDQWTLFHPLSAKFKFLWIPVNPSGGMCSHVPIEYPCRFLAPLGRVSILKWSYLQKPNSPHVTCSVKCPN
jgi:hypothetical protein